MFVGRRPTRTRRQHEPALALGTIMTLLRPASATKDTPKGEAEVTLSPSLGRFAAIV
jgi:hypothetical protein